MIAVSSPPVGTEVLATALVARRFGISCVPIQGNGTKHPGVHSWKSYQRRLPSFQELKRWFSSPNCGIAFVTGEVSGSLEALDFDSREAYKAWQEMVQSIPRVRALFERIARGYMEATPSGGVHLLYRCPSIEGNQKLALGTVGGKQKPLIETRGEGGLIIVAPSPACVHPSGKPYRLVRGDVGAITSITPDEREALFALARYLDKSPPAAPRLPTPIPTYASTLEEADGCGDCGPGSMRPGDVFNRRASWAQVLEPAGWELARNVGEVCYWRQPGKKSRGWNATTNYGGSDLFYSFSTSTVFEAGRGYTKFQAYAVLNQGGDYAAAARDLAARGFSDRR
jgi:putative DNA primase/helicase